MSNETIRFSRYLIPYRHKHPSDTYAPSSNQSCERPEIDIREKHKNSICPIIIRREMIYFFPTKKQQRAVKHYLNPHEIEGVNSYIFSLRAWRRAFSFARTSSKWACLYALRCSRISSLCASLYAFAFSRSSSLCASLYALHLCLCSSL